MIEDTALHMIDIYIQSLVFHMIENSVLLDSTKDVLTLTKFKYIYSLNHV